MSGRTQGSVRTGSPTAEASAAEDGPADDRVAEPVPASTTQAIPTTGPLRAEAAGAGSATAAAAPSADRAAPAAPRPASGSVAQAAAAATAAGPAAPASPASASRATTGAPPVPQANTATAAGGARGRSGKAGRGPRRARLQLRHIDTWSALKISLVLSIALFFIWMVAVGILYGVLNQLGVFETLNDLFGQVGSVSGNAATGDVITPGVVFGGAAVIGAINIVLMTALCTVGTFIYNLCSDLVGGLEVTLSERD